MSRDILQSSYPPSLFDTSILVFEGTAIACILYGSYVVISGSSPLLLRKQRMRLLLSYSIVQLMLTTLYFAILLYIIPAQILAIFNVIDPHSQDALSPWPGVIVNATFVLNTWASDGFPLYRCYIICVRTPRLSGSQRLGNKFTAACALLFYLGTLGFSVAWLVVEYPGTVYGANVVRVTNLCYWSCSTAMTICASCLVCVQFWRHQQECAMLKSRTIALVCMEMMLESALLYTVFVFIALILTVLQSPLKNVFCPVLGMVQGISPALIIYRIARGISHPESATDIADGLPLTVLGQPQAITRPDYQESYSGLGTTCASLGGDGSSLLIRNYNQETG